jgi:RNA polymerase sigma factor (sigma-70 family)
MTTKALAVFAKEALDASRDRRSLTSALSFALFGPLVLAMALATIAKSSNDDGPLKLAVSGAAHAPSLVRYLEQNGVEMSQPAADVQAAVRRGDLKVALVIPPGYGKYFRASRPARVEGERRDRLREAVRQLPLAARQVIVLSLEGLSQREIGDVLGITENNVAVRLTRARKLLRRALQTEGSRR